MERMAAIRALSEASFSMATAAVQGMAKNFDLPRVRVLRMVAADGPVRPQQIGAHLDLAPSTVTRHVQALEDAGQVRVDVDPDDARTCLVMVTAAGEQELKEIGDRGQQVYEQVVESWKTADIDRAAKFMERLVDDWADRGDGARHRSGSREPRWRSRPKVG